MGTHRQSLRNKATAALSNGIPIFVTEWGTCSADGNGNLDLASTQLWLDFLKENDISDANWAISDKEEACAALRPGSSPQGNWDVSRLTESGAFIRTSIRSRGSFSPSPRPVPTPGPDTPAPTPSPPNNGHCSSDGEDCRGTKCCSDGSLTCYEKDEYWGSCRADCIPGINPVDPVQFQTPWTCNNLDVTARTETASTTTSTTTTT